MDETTAVDINCLCAYCGRPKCQCICGCTARSEITIMGEKNEIL